MSNTSSHYFLVAVPIAPCFHVSVAQNIGVILELRQHGTTKCGYGSNAVISILALLCPCGTECIDGNFFAGRPGHG
jgi:hypothetical protein